MKVNVVEENKKVFKPIKLKLVIETERELCDLWHRLGLLGRDVNEMSNGYSKYGADSAISFWNTVDNLIESNNLRK